MSTEQSERVAVLVSADLLARSRVDDATSRAGWRLVVTSPSDLSGTLGATRANLLVLDLDSGGRALLDDVAHARGEGVVPARVVGFFSHVDTELGAAAASSGCEAMPRGRFWRTLPELLAGA